MKKDDVEVSLKVRPYSAFRTSIPKHIWYLMGIIKKGLIGEKLCGKIFDVDSLL